ncbi:MAG: pentapeptide repeat-containing protein [Microthrixaceae bacterium]
MELDGQAPETTDPETAAPETADPETADPETAEGAVDAEESPGRSSRYKWVAGITVVALLLGAIGLTLQSRSSSEQVSETTDQVSREAAGGLGLNIVKFLAENIAIGGVQGAGFYAFDSAMGALFPEAPDPSLAKLDELKAEVNGISVQVEALQQSVNSLSSRLDQTYYSGVSTQLANDFASVRNLHNEFIVPLAAEGQIYSRARLAGDTAAMQAAEINLKAAKQDFLDEYSANFNSNANAIDHLHEYIVPASGELSILSARGKVLMQKGYLTQKDSLSLRDLYTDIAQQEALAVWMNAEYHSLKDNGDGVQQALSDQIVTSWKTQQPVEFAALPPLIPSGVIITTPNSITAGAFMWLSSPKQWGRSPTDRYGALFTNSPEYDPTVFPKLQAQVNGGVVFDASVTPQVDSYGSTVTGWDYPSSADQVSGLNAGLKTVPGASIAERLNTAGSGLSSAYDYKRYPANDVNFGNNRVWLSPSKLVTIRECPTSNPPEDIINAPQFVDLRESTASIGQWDDPKACVEWTNADSVAAWSPASTNRDAPVSRILWVRTVGSGTQEDYMAQSGITNYELPTSTFPDAPVDCAVPPAQGVDLSGCNLNGASLSSKNLSGAKFIGTQLNNTSFYFSNLTSADLTKASLIEADLNYANFTEANLTGANLDYAVGNVDLTRANLTDANLRGFAPTGANLTGANLTNAILTNVAWNNTVCPDGTNSKASTPQTCIGHL